MNHDDCCMAGGPSMLLLTLSKQYKEDKEGVKLPVPQPSCIIT